MKFCVKCDNMYYMKIQEENSNELIYYCRFCGHEDNSLASQGALKVYKYEKKANIKSNVINELTKYDPTLPHVTNIRCPNQDCVTNDKSNPKEVDTISIRYDNSNMKYIYLCCHCNISWKA